MLTKSGLQEEEMKHVLGLTNGELKFSAVRRHMVELYPTGSSKTRRHGAHYAEYEDVEDDTPEWVTRRRAEERVGGAAREVGACLVREQRRHAAQQRRDRLTGAVS